MSDLFQDAVPDEYIESVASVMLQAHWHTYQVLTKRSGRLRDLLTTKLRDASRAPHIWWGVSVEDKSYGLRRIDDLRGAPARVRFLSIEPLLEDLGSINLSGIHWAIVGGESGPGARVMHPDWVRRIKEQCDRAGVLFFFKQWGGVQKGKYGRVFDGRTYDDMPKQTSTQIPAREERQQLAKVLAPMSKGWAAAPLVQLQLGERLAHS
jgi:protein gp37